MRPATSRRARAGLASRGRAWHRGWCAAPASQLQGRQRGAPVQVSDRALVERPITMDQREWEEIRARLDAAKAELDDRIDELQAVRDDLEAFSDAYEDAAFERELDAEFTESDAFAPPPRLPA